MKRAIALTVLTLLVVSLLAACGETHNQRDIKPVSSVSTSELHPT
jgi:hypothetical protein